MTARRYALLYVVAFLVFIAFDAVWLAFVAKDFYRARIGHVLADGVNWGAAIAFYPVFVSGIVFFAVLPALEQEAPTRAAVLGGAYGFYTYWTYELTNMATLEAWPITVVIVDLTWGVALCAVVATVTTIVALRTNLAP